MPALSARSQLGCEKIGYIRDRREPGVLGLQIGGGFLEKKMWNNPMHEARFWPSNGLVVGRIVRHKSSQNRILACTTAQASGASSEDNVLFWFTWTKPPAKSLISLELGLSFVHGTSGLTFIDPGHWLSCMANCRSQDAVDDSLAMIGADRIGAFVEKNSSISIEPSSCRRARARHGARS